MRHIDSDIEGNCKLVKSSRQSVDFLLAYSKSLQITKAKGLHFEMILN